MNELWLLKEGRTTQWKGVDPGAGAIAHSFVWGETKRALPVVQMALQWLICACFRPNRNQKGEVRSSCVSCAHGPARDDVFWVMQVEYNQRVSSVCVPNSRCVIYCSTWNTFTRCTRLHNQTIANSTIMMACEKMCIHVAKTWEDHSGQLLAKCKYPKFELFGGIVMICLGYLCGQSLV